MPWTGSRKIWIAALLILVPVAAFGASEATISFSLGAADHIATILESASVCLTGCGAFYVWISKTREARAKAITAEIAVAFDNEREAREDDVGGLERAVAKLASDIEIIRSNSAKVEDVANLYRLVEKVADRADSQHQALREQMTTLIGGITLRLDRLSERRLVARESE